MLTTRKHKTSKAGFISIIALLMLFVFVSLSISIAATTDLELQKANNTKLIFEAQLATESGLEYSTHLLKSLEFSGGASISDVVDSLAVALSNELDGQALLQGEPVAYDGNMISIPSISLSEGKSFRIELAAASATELQLRIYGQSSDPHGTVRRSISLNAELGDSGSVDEYGIYSKGPVTIGQNFELWGANSPEEGSVLSVASNEAISITSGYIDGDVATSDPNASVDIGATVNGYILTEVEAVAPVIDGSVFEPYATNIVDGTTDTSGGTFTNTRIIAGTNPVFGSVTVTGVMYIEAPNYVNFNNNVNITGIIVSEDPGAGADPDDHYVYFKNNLTMNGLEELPDTSDFTELRNMAGAAFILPGFTLEFKNNFETVSGHIVADQIIFKNNMDGTIYGSLIVLGDDGLTLKNNGNLTIDNSKYGGGATAGVTPGGTALKNLSFVPDTYEEN